MTRAFLIVLFAAVGQPLQAQSICDESRMRNDCYLLGVTLRISEEQPRVMLDVPFTRARTRLGTDYLRFAHGGRVTVGLAPFYLEAGLDVGMYLYPFGEGVSLHVLGQAGSFALDNITYSGSLGANVDIPLGDGRLLLVGGEVFRQHAAGLLNWASLPGEPSGNRTGKGVTVGIRY